MNQAIEKLKLIVGPYDQGALQVWLNRHVHTCYTKFHVTESAMRSGDDGRAFKDHIAKRGYEKLGLLLEKRFPVQWEKRLKFSPCNELEPDGQEGLIEVTVIR